MFYVKHESVSFCMKLCVILVTLFPNCFSAEKLTPVSYNQSYHNHRTGPATSIPWNVLFDPSYSGVAKIEADSLKSTTDSSVSIFYGHSAYTPSTYGQSSKKKISYSYKSLVSTTKPTTTISPYKSPVVVAYSSPDEEEKTNVNFLKPTYSQVYPDQESGSDNNNVEARIQAPVYREGTYSRPYYPEYSDEEDKRPVYNENTYRKKPPINDRRPQEFYTKKKSPTYTEPEESSDDPFESLPDSFDDSFMKRPIPPSYKKGKNRLKKPDRYIPGYHINKPEYSSESKHHPFYNYDYYGDYYDHDGPPIHIKHRVYSKKKSKYAPLALALGLLPLGLMLAAIVPSVMTIPATVTTAAGRKKRNVLDQKYTNPVLDAITTYGVRNLDDPMCLQRIFCQVTNEGKEKKSNFFQKIFYKIAKLVDESWAEKFGMKLLVRAIKKDKCEFFPCPPKDKKKKS